MAHVKINPNQNPAYGEVIGDGGGGGGNYQTVQVQGVDQPPEPALNFNGPYFAATDTPGVSTDLTILDATDVQAGLMSAADKAKVDTLVDWVWNGLDVTIQDAALGSIGNQAVRLFFKGNVLEAGAHFLPDTANTWQLGAQSDPWLITWADLFGTLLGAPLASAATIAPTTGVHHITGSVDIDTITPPIADFVGTINFIVDDGLSFTTAGNIANAVTANAGNLYIATFDGTLWYIAPGTSRTPGTSTVFFSLADTAKTGMDLKGIITSNVIDNVSTSHAGGGGPKTRGVAFFVTDALSCTGARFYWNPNTGAKTVRIALWNYTSQAVVNFVDVAVNNSGIYTGTFAAASALTPGLQYVISCSEQSGADDNFVFGINSTNFPAQFTVPPFVAASNYKIADFGLFVNAVNTFPSNGSSGVLIPIDPLIS